MSIRTRMLFASILLVILPAAILAYLLRREMESSLEERRELAKELGYTGSNSDTATMNIWLHKQVMKKLAENGGKVPAALLD